MILRLLQIGGGICILFMLIAICYGYRWGYMALCWHWQYARDHGIGQSLRNLYHPIQTLRRIRQEVPGADRVYRRSGYWLCIAVGLMIILACFLGIYMLCFLNIKGSIR